MRISCSSEASKFRWGKWKISLGSMSTTVRWLSGQTVSLSILFWVWIPVVVDVCVHLVFASLLWAYLLHSDQWDNKKLKEWTRNINCKFRAKVYVKYNLHCWFVAGRYRLPGVRARLATRLVRKSVTTSHRVIVWTKYRGHFDSTKSFENSWLEKRTPL